MTSGTRNGIWDVIHLCGVSSTQCTMARSWIEVFKKYSRVAAIYGCGFEHHPNNSVPLATKAQMYCSVACAANFKMDDSCFALSHLTHPFPHTQCLIYLCDKILSILP